MGPRLRGDGVLVTRPAHQAESLCRAIAAAGGRPLRFAVLDIAPPRDPQAARARLARAADDDFIIFISPNAVAGAHGLGAHLPPPVRLAAVGKGTGRELERLFGRGPDIVPDGRCDSEGLLASAPLQAVAGRRVLIVRGEGGRELLAEALRARGARVDYAEVYRRVLPAGDAAALVAAGARGEVAVAVVTSGEGLENLCTLVDAAGGGLWLRGLPLIVVSGRTAVRAAELGFRLPPLVATGADDEALMEALGRWCAGASATKT